MITPRPPALHQRDDGAAQAERACQIDRKRPVPVLGREVDHGSGRCQGGCVVDQNIGRPEMSQDFGKCPVRGRLPGHIQTKARNVMAQPCGCATGRCTVKVTECCLRAFCNQSGTLSHSRCHAQRR